MMPSRIIILLLFFVHGRGNGCGFVFNVVDIYSRTDPVVRSRDHRGISQFGLNAFSWFVKGEIQKIPSGMRQFIEFANAVNSVSALEILQVLALKFRFRRYELH